MTSAAFIVCVAYGLTAGGFFESARRHGSTLFVAMFLAATWPADFGRWLGDVANVRAERRQ